MVEKRPTVNPPPKSPLLDFLAVLVGIYDILDIPPRFHTILTNDAYIEFSHPKADDAPVLFLDDWVEARYHGLLAMMGQCGIQV